VTKAMSTIIIAKNITFLFIRFSFRIVLHELKFLKKHLNFNEPVFQ
jgi:hypothetical protein